MFNPTIEQIGNLSEVNKKLRTFYNDFSANYDADNELDTQLKQMLDLIQEGFIAVYEEMKRRI